MTMKRFSIAAPLLCLIALSACMDGGGAQVSRNAAEIDGCPNIPEMNTVAGMDVRCGPQAALPYTYSN
jgi:hypothetical protein